MENMPRVWGGGAVFGYAESGDCGLHGRLCTDGIGIDFDDEHRCSLMLNTDKVADITPLAVLPDYVSITADLGGEPCDIIMAAVSRDGVYIHVDRDVPLAVNFGSNYDSTTYDGGCMYRCGDRDYALAKRAYSGGVVYAFATGDECRSESDRIASLAPESVSEDLLSVYKKLGIPDSVSDIYRPLYMRCSAIVRNGVSSKGCFGKRTEGKFSVSVVSALMRAVALKDMYSEYARATVLKIADYISADGFLPSDITAYCCNSVAPPIVCYAFDEIFGKDRDMVEAYYDRLRSCIKYFADKRDINKDYTYQLSSGDKGEPGRECGMPNSPRFDAGVLQSSPDVSGYMYLAALAMGNMSRTINRNDDIIYWGVLAQRVAAGANSRLYDKSKGFYYDRPIIGSHFVDVRTTAGFMPLYAGFVPEEHISGLVGLTDDPTAFRTGRGIATIAVSDSCYSQDINRGSMSLFECYKIIKGMVNSGYVVKAQNIAARVLDTVLRAYEEDGLLYSHYSSDRRVSHRRQKLFGKSIMPACRSNFDYVADCPETAAFVLAIVNMMAEENC